VNTSTSRQILIVVAISILLALMYNTFSPKGLPLIRTEPAKTAISDSALFNSLPPESLSALASKTDSAQWKDIKVIAPLHEKALHNPDSMKEVVRTNKEEQPFSVITLDQLQRLLKAHRGILFDARSEEDYVKGHIKGARNVPGEDPGKHFPQFVELPRDTLIIVYCNNPECHLGRSVIEFLATMEFKKMVLYDDGWDGWEKAHLPVDTTIVKF